MLLMQFGSESSTGICNLPPLPNFPASHKHQHESSAFIQLIGGLKNRSILPMWKAEHITTKMLINPRGSESGSTVCRSTDRYKTEGSEMPETRNPGSKWTTVYKPKETTLDASSIHPISSHLSRTSYVLLDHSKAPGKARISLGSVLFLSAQT